MGRYIIRLKDYYLEWSTVVDAPVTYGMKLEEFEDYYRAEYGEQGMAELPARMARVAETGCSAIHDRSPVYQVISWNRAGENETSLTPEKIYEKFCVNRPREVGQ